MGDYLELETGTGDVWIIGCRIPNNVFFSSGVDTHAHVLGNGVAMDAPCLTIVVGSHQLNSHWITG